MSEMSKLDAALNILDEKKGEDIVAYDIKEVSSLADYIIICTGSSDVHLRALADYMMDELEKYGSPLLRKDGYGFSKWVCLDFGDIIVHLMGSDERDYYNLENIWGGCDKIIKEQIDR